MMNAGAESGEEVKPNHGRNCQHEGQVTTVKRIGCRALARGMMARPGDVVEQIGAVALSFASGTSLLLVTPLVASVNASATLYGIGWALIGLGLVCLFRRSSLLWVYVKPTAHL